MFSNGFINLLPLAQGALWTIALTVTAGGLGIIFGLIFGLAETSPSRIARWISTIYVTVIRGIPLLILIFFIYFGLPLLVPGADLPGFLTGAIALTAFATAYIAEIFRGSIEAIPKGQSEAADALGLSYSRKFRHVILPQAVKIAVAPGITFLIGLVKDSSLISVIAFMELTRAGNIVSNLTYDPITTYLVVAAIYFIICYGISLLGRKYEKSLGVQIDPLNVVPPLSLQIGQSR